MTRRAIERLRTAEAMAAFVHRFDATVWPPLQAALELGLIDYWKYTEHTWGQAGSACSTCSTSGPGRSRWMRR